MPKIKSERIMVREDVIRSNGAGKFLCNKSNFLKESFIAKTVQKSLFTKQK